MRALSIVGMVGVVACVYLFLISPPTPFPKDQVLAVESGQSVTSISAELKTLGALRSPLIFKVFAKAFGGAQAGWYGLDGPENVITLAWRISHGETGLESKKVTIPEGSSVREIAELVGVPLPSNQEGFLFPDTYYFLPGSPQEMIVERMRERYEVVVAPLRPEIAASGHTEKEILTMASILEKEARQSETMRMVSGILWKRVDLGMALQVDAVFGYIKGIDTYHPILDDLKIDSLYNTYLYPGLPPGPINNPGLEAIKAALEPTKSRYLYYLTGKDGTMHYAKTFEEHKANKQFLR